LVDTQHVTIRDQEYTSYIFGLYVRETYNPASTYTGDQNVNAYYAMLDLPLTSRLRFIGGTRYEITDMNLITKNSKLLPGKLNNHDILPSVNFIYMLTTDMNMRASYGRTLARPTFREIAPYSSFDFMGGDTYLGYASLQRTLIDNLDLRWEWFSRPGEIYAISAFWKKFDQPIERVFNRFGENTWRNVDQARVYGVEFELRKRLDVLYAPLNNFLLGSNLSLVNSWVDINAEELRLIRTTRPDTDATRPLLGQSPYLFNVSLTYDDITRGMVATLYYNIFGDRLYKVSLAGTPDVYEKPAHLLNFTFSWAFTPHFNLKFSAINLLNSYSTQYNEYKNVEYIWSQYREGRTFKLGLGYKL
jgi:TonB-dependent receptor